MKDLHEHLTRVNLYSRDPGIKYQFARAANLWSRVSGGTSRMKGTPAMSQLAHVATMSSASPEARDTMTSQESGFKHLLGGKKQ